MKNNVFPLFDVPDDYLECAIEAINFASDKFLVDYLISPLACAETAHYSKSKLHVPLIVREDNDKGLTKFFVVFQSITNMIAKFEMISTLQDLYYTMRLKKSTMLPFEVEILNTKNKLLTIANKKNEKA